MFSSQNSQVSNDANYIEDVFSTYLYTGDSTARSIVNGIDLAGKGGLVWIKRRSSSGNHQLWDTNRGTDYRLFTDSPTSQNNVTNLLTAFNADGYSLGTDGNVNESVSPYNLFSSWTFRKQPKFFDVVTYTGNGTSQEIAHSLGSIPGCLIIKRTDASANWPVWQRNIITSFGFYRYMTLNTSDAVVNDSTVFGVGPDETVFRVGSNSMTNASGGTYVAYIFAHNAGGFGLTGTDNVISCGSYTGNGSSTGPVIDLGYEPQWLLIKKADSATANTGWAMFDNMRGLRNSGGVFLYANSSAAEDSSVNIVSALATGFQPVQSGFLTNGNGSTYIYIAIRRGPMKVPTSGTSVFAPVLSSTTPTVLTSNFPVDMALSGTRTPSAYEKGINDRLRGFSNTSSGTSPWIVTQYTVAEAANTGSPSYYSADNTSITIGSYFSGATLSNYLFRRAPSFFDEVCYTGTGSATTIPHNLGVAPELMIVKSRSNGALGWYVYSTGLGPTKCNQLNQNASQFTSSSYWNDTAPTSTVFSLGSGGTNGSGNTQVAYLFATCAGVSKVGTYTGTGATQTIACGFTGGARFVLIKRIDDVGDWWVWDTARGMVSGTDPRLALDLTSAESNANWVYTTTGGFQIVTNNVEVNQNGGSYIFLAIA